MRIVKNIVYVIITLAVVFGVFYGLYNISVYDIKKKKAQIDRHRGLTTGRIIKTGSMKGSYAIAEYCVGGRSYTAKNVTPADDFHRGYRFQIEYDSTDPAVSNILFEYPFFEKSDILDSTTGTVVFHDRFKLGFEYAVRNRKYRKFQGLKPGETIDDAQRFQVYFLANDPSNSILKLPYITKISW